MNEPQKPLVEEVKEIRKKRGIHPKDFEMMTGIPLETAKKMKNGDEIIEKFTIAYTPDSLKILSSMTSGVTEVIDDFLNLLGEKELGFGKLADGAKLHAKFELSAYMLFILDVFASEHQTPEARTEIFYVVGNEILKSLKEISPDYQKSEFDKEIDKRMSQYSVFIREPNSVFKVPSDISAWNLLQEHLTNAVVKGGFARKELDGEDLRNWTLGEKSVRDDSNKPIDVVSSVYGMICQQAERNFRLMINELFSAGEDIRDFSIQEVGDIIEIAKEKIAKLDEENIKSVG